MNKNPNRVISTAALFLKATRLSASSDSKRDELGSDPEEAYSDSAGQSGDAQGLSQIADADEESVGELAETDQAYEAGTVDGLEDAADHPERPVRTRENQGRG
jgi:hypothetical protein